MQRKVGILTWHQYHNFGSMLQAYALQTTLGQLGAETEIINYYDPATIQPPGKMDCAKYLVKKAFSYVGLYKLLPDYFSFQRFYYDRLRKSRIVASRDELSELAARYGCIVFGSDQIWAPNVFNPVYMGDFADKNKIRLVSYAASIGLNDIPDELRPVYHRLLSRFSRISVREEKGKNLLEECCGLQSEVVLDPTLLMEASEYRKIERPLAQVTEPFIFCYFLNKDHIYRDRVETYAKKTGLKIYGVSARPEDSQWMELLPTTGPEEFLWLVDHAETIFTDSYHGTIFSLQFQKNFWTFERFSKNDPICQNSRIRQLDAHFGIGGRILAPDMDVDETVKLDYGAIGQKLQHRRSRSMEYLQEVLY